MGELRDAYRARQGVSQAHLAAVCRSRCKPFVADRKNCQRRKKKEIKLGAGAMGLVLAHSLLSVEATRPFVPAQIICLRSLNAYGQNFIDCTLSSLSAQVCACLAALLAHLRDLVSHCCSRIACQLHQLLSGLAAGSRSDQ